MCVCVHACVCLCVYATHDIRMSITYNKRKQFYRKFKVKIISLTNV